MSDDYVNVPIPEEEDDDDDDDVLFGDMECFLAHPNEDQVWEIGICETEVDTHNLPSPSEALQYVLRATPERKKRTEVGLRDLSPEERRQFSEAKGKEVDAWLHHQTIKRERQVSCGSQLMRCRWILAWKAPLQEGGPRRAKARLVVLGFEDPELSTIPNDAPTLGKDARQLLIQQVVSRGWKLINFDISTAFLQGKGDGRKLGIKPPDELRNALKMGPSDQCLLQGGAMED